MHLGSLALVPHAWNPDPAAVSQSLRHANDNEDGWRAADFALL
jgi:hypothetical protein